MSEYLLARREQKPLAPKANTELRYVTMAGRSHWLLLRESLVSLHRAWHSIPQLTVVSDGSWKPDEFLAAFNFWPNPIKVLMPDDICGALTGAGQNALAELARAHPLGLKLAAIILSAQQEAILFVDSDILWFSDPSKILTQMDGLPGPIVSVEKESSYNEDLARQFYPEGMSPPPINTGCVYLKGPLCDGKLLQDLLAAALKDPRHNFNEQTIVAVAVQKNGRKFPAEFCLVDFADAMTWKRRKPWQQGFHSRHYVNWMRHQFYRDALALRRMPSS